MKKLLILLLFLPLIGLGQGWFTTFGGAGNDGGQSVQQTTDGGYIITGGTSSFGNADVYLIKTDSNGDSLWTKTFGETIDDYGFSVQQTTDGGYIISGVTEDCFNCGLIDVYLIKTNSNGDSLWTKTFGDFESEWGYSVQQTTDGGYIISGYTESFWSQTPPLAGSLYLIKTDSNGSSLWTKYLYAGTDPYDSDIGYSVQQTTDGGYIITGTGSSTGIFLIKTDGNGVEQWNQNFGTPSNDYGYSVQQTTDGGYIITGKTNFFGNGDWDVYLIKTDGNGVEQWNQNFGGTSNDAGSSVQQTTDGGYIITGYTESFGNGGSDVYLIKTDGNGVEQWNQTFGGASNDGGSSVQQTTDADYIVTGYTGSFGNGGNDVYLIKIDGSNINGCINTNSSQTEIVCDDYLWNGTNYTISGIYTYSDINSMGCDSTITLNLTINNSTTSTTSVTECDSYTWNGITYTTSGSYTYVTMNSNGCDSTATLNLTINNSTTSTTSVTECDSYTWSVNGITYTSSIVDTVIGVNAAGCTETNILNLIINSSSISTTSITECDSYTWSVNGVNYTTSVIDTVIGVNAAGCTETNILNLIINGLTTSTTSVTECDSYTWNGITYTTSGSYTYVTMNSNGCDSTATLNLTINNSTTSTTSVTECDSYTWSVNGITYTSSIVDTVIGVNAAGCTETNILNLIINNASTPSIVLGNTQVSYLSTETYNIAQNIGSIFSWNLESGGIIINGQTTNSIEVQWGNNSGTYELYVIETDINGCVGDTVFLSVNVSNSTNVEDLDIDKLTLYPNPSQDVFNIEFTSVIRQDLEVRIINSIGEIVYIDNLNNYIGEYKKQISLEEYSKAIYFLEIHTDDGIVNKKLILQ